MLRAKLHSPCQVLMPADAHQALQSGTARTSGLQANETQNAYTACHFVKSVAATQCFPLKDRSSFIEKSRSQSKY
jgi:hypothetical protein